MQTQCVGPQVFEPCASILQKAPYVGGPEAIDWLAVGCFSPEGCSGSFSARMIAKLVSWAIEASPVAALAVL